MLRPGKLGVDGQQVPGSEPVHWTKGELIGAGAFGRVYIGLNNNTGQLMAVKQASSSAAFQSFTLLPLCSVPEAVSSCRSTRTKSRSLYGAHALHFVMPAFQASMSVSNTGAKVSECMQVLISKDKHVAGRVKEHVEGLEAEVTMLRHLDHPNIVRYLVSHFHTCHSVRTGPRMNAGS